MRAKQKGNIMLRQVIYGPPGTGKSTAIIKRAEFYTEKYDKDQIALCSYTKAAAEVLAKRCDIKSKWIGTIHSLAFKLAGVLREQVINTAKLREFSHITGIQFSGVSINELDEQLHIGDYYLARYNLLQSQLRNDIDATDLPGSQYEFEYFYKSYEKWKIDYGYIDYSDMLKLALQQNPLDVQVLFIDESQDLSKLQWEVIKYWSKNIPIIHIAGDDDQAIYEWAGADPQGMYNFEKEYDADRVVLNQSHRVPIEIHKKALNITKAITKRVDKVYNPKEKSGVVNYYSDIEQLQDIKHGEDILILYRNHSMRKNIEEYFIKYGIPYITDNGSKGLCQGHFWKLIKTYKKLQKTKNYSLTKAQNKLLNKGLQYRYKYLLGTENEHSIFDEPWQNTLNLRIDEIMYYEYIEKLNINLEIEPTIHLSTIHGAKGREADRVILVNGLGELSAESYYQCSNAIEQEARVFYVGVTRAKKRLDIILGDNPVEFL